MIDTVSLPVELRQRVGEWRAGGARIGFVPTMGNLHRGHLNLVEQAKRDADRVVVSIFVNPKQFGPSEDFERYPRTLEADSRALETPGVDLLFTPTTQTVYPRGEDASTRVEIPRLGDSLCGAKRPGHFVGVATVVTILLNIVQPDFALFGQKDYQQFLLLKRMAEDLMLPVEVRMAPTVRENDGLAMSSRNGYLSEEERSKAANLYRALTAAKAMIEQGDRAFGRIEADGLAVLKATGFEPDYFAVRDADTLGPVEPGCRSVAVLAAARLGDTRLIDNLLFPLG